MKTNKVDYYTFQLSTYELLLSSAGYPTANYGYLLFFWPKKVDNNCMVQFETKLLQVPTRMQVVKDTIIQAKDCLENDMPDSNPECEMCKYIQEASGRINSLNKDKENIKQENF